MIVVDASVLAAALADDNSDGDAARAGLRGHALAAPELIDLEVASVWRRLVLVGQLEARRADFAVADLLELPLQRIPHRQLVSSHELSEPASGDNAVVAFGPRGPDAQRRVRPPLTTAGNNTRRTT